MRCYTFAGLCLGLVAGCVTDPPIDLLPAGTVVEGSVSTESGAVVAGAMVVATARYPRARTEEIAQDSAATDATGYYAIDLSVLNQPDASAPAEVTVRPGPGYSQATAAGITVHFRTELPWDTTRVDMIVGP